MQVSEESRGPWHVIVISGRVDAEGSDSLESTLRLAAEQHPRIAADFAAVAYISSAGLRAMLQGARAAQNAGHEFLICNLTPPVRKIFEISGLQQVLRIVGDLPC